MTQIVLVVPFIQNAGVAQMARNFPTLKARAEWIHWALECIKTNTGDYQAMRGCIVARWRKISQRTKEPSPRNSLRAVFGPTLRHLELIAGDGDEIKLTAKGDELLEIYHSDGESGFKKVFAKHLVKLDKERWVGIVFEIQHFGQPISQDELLDHLIQKYPNADISSDKLKKLMLQYVYTGLVILEGKAIHLREPLLHSIMTDLDVRLSDQQFVRALHKAYKKLSSHVTGTPYVPIPKIRDEVCRETKIWPADFDGYLQKLPKETSEYLIHLTEPMLRKPDGVRVAGKYLYYFAIYEKR